MIGGGGYVKGSFNGGIYHGEKRIFMKGMLDSPASFETTMRN